MARVLLIVGGGIAAYKSLELVRLLKKAGHEVTPVLTKGGEHFVTAMSLGTLAEAQVHTSLWELKDEVEIGHIQLNRFVETRPVSERIGPDNARHLLAAHDLVIDGSDNFATRLAVSDTCVALDIPLLSAAAVQFQGQVGLFRSRPCYRCFVGDAFDADDCDNCAELGVLGALTGAVGNFAALLAINSIIGIGDEQAGMLHLFDGELLSWRTIRIPAEPGCKMCGST
jgi:molybdopterin/thiamine biosynthesis adenylyltransferase